MCCDLSECGSSFVEPIHNFIYSLLLMLGPHIRRTLGILFASTVVTIPSPHFLLGAQEVQRRLKRHSYLLNIERHRLMAQRSSRATTTNAFDSTISSISSQLFATTCNQQTVSQCTVHELSKLRVPEDVKMSRQRYGCHLSCRSTCHLKFNTRQTDGGWQAGNYLLLTWLPWPDSGT